MPTERSRLLRGTLLVLLAAGALVVGLLLVFDKGVGPIPDPEGCQARVGGVVVDLTTEQARNAATISAVAVRRGLPARAASIALATAFQESKLRNLDHGDRDSVGLFQQRPSQGWGTVRQIRRPLYATNRFYDALEKIDGYQTMRITVAAQKVQRSGFPEAYADHAADGRALASALTGYSAARFSCVVHDAGSGATGTAGRVEQALGRAFGDLRLADPTAETEGRTLDVVVRADKAVGRRKGWAVASYLVAHASRLRVDHVVFADRVWTAGRSSESGWRDYHKRSVPGRVHVEVLRGS